MLQYKRS
nr:unnamed protein product [Callosobruchus analis]